MRLLRRSSGSARRSPIPSTATRSPAFAGAFRKALNVVSPAHSSGAASTDDRASGSPLAFRDHHFGIAAVMMNAGIFLVTAVDEIAVATELAVAARPAEKPDTHALTDHPALDTRAKPIDPPPDDLMT